MEKKAIEIKLDPEVAAMLLDLAGSPRRLSACVDSLIRAEIARRKADQLVDLEARAARLRAELAEHLEIPHVR